MGKLTGAVAVVAGATRGAGRGIATALGEAGATVYCTGRSVRGAPSDMGRPETLDETAERVNAAGGVGIPVRVDHLRESEVQALFERVSAEQQGRLDVLVNDVWGGDANAQWGVPFWEMDAGRAWSLLETALRTHLITARHGAPLLVKRGKGLIVEVTDGNQAWYRGALAYDLAKAAVTRLAFGMAEELRPHGVTALALTPGFLRSEAVLDHFGVTEATWREGAKKDPHFAHSETPLYVGRAVAALAADPNVLERSGRVWSSWDLAKAYGFTDADGTRPDWGAHWRDAFPGVGKPLDDAYWSYLEGWSTLRTKL